jgi:ABC-2 type transport system permease protein
MRLSSLLNHRITAVIENEWAQLTRSRVVIFTTLVPPTLLVAVALMLLFLSSLIDAEAFLGNPDIAAFLAANDIAPSTLTQGDLLRAALLSPFLVLFQMIPLIVPITIASYTIIGEKQSRSLEALLATPIRTWELLLGKALAAALPAILVSWYSFIIFAATARFVVSARLYQHLVVGPTWMLTVTIVAPLLTLLAVGLGIVISSRVRDAQSAQQLGSLVIVPLIGTLVAQLTGALNINVGIVLTSVIVLCLIDLLLFALAVRLFKRETILTSWR